MIWKVMAGVILVLGLLLYYVGDRMITAEKNLAIAERVSKENAEEVKKLVTLREKEALDRMKLDSELAAVRADYSNALRSIGQLRATLNSRAQDDPDTLSRDLSTRLRSGLDGLRKATGGREDQPATPAGPPKATRPNQKPRRRHTPSRHHKERRHRYQSLEARRYLRRHSRATVALPGGGTRGLLALPA